MIRKTVILLLLFSLKTLHSETGIVSEIQINGLWRTSESVVPRELPFSPGELYSREMEQESLTRLRNLLLFSDVKIDSEILNDESLLITITVKEKWTIIPIFKAGGGGGINYLTIGSYDINVLGQYLELGAQYERLGNTNSGVFWFRDPRFLDKRLKLSADIWQLSRNHLLYDDEAEMSGGYTNRRNRAHIYLEKEWRPAVLVGLGIDYTQDSYSQGDLESDARLQNQMNALTLPDGSSHLGTYISTQLGQLNYNNYLVEGVSLNLKLNYGFGLNDQSDDFIQKVIVLKGFYLLSSGFGNLAAQLTMAESSSEDPHFQYYVGGLDAVRGYYHGQFLTPAYWKLNGEYRLESIKSECFVLQHIFFTDIGNLGENIHASLTSRESPFIGYGVGLRLISPRVYRFNVRLDYGVVAGRDGPGGLSFGFQQFF